MPAGKMLLNRVTTGESGADSFLTGNPQITFFKAVFKRYTHYVIQTYKHQSGSEIGYGKTVSFNIGRYGSLLNQIFLEVNLCANSTFGNNINYVNCVNNTAHSLIKEVSVHINNELIEKHDGTFLDILSELNDRERQDWPLLNKHAAKDAYLTSNTELVNNRMYIPLQFWFCKNPGMALPLISMEMDLVIKIEFRSLAALVNADGLTDVSTDSSNNLEVSLYSEQIHLTPEEEHMFKENDQQYLITQVQKVEANVSGNGPFKLDLSSINHPIKQLIWVCRDATSSTENTLASNITNIDATENIEGSAFSHKNDFMNYDCASSTNSRYLYGERQFEHFSKARIHAGNAGIPYMDDMDAVYYRTIQPINHYGIYPYKKIYMYSFCLRPADDQPTGTMNFSMMDNTEKYIQFTDFAVGSGSSTTITLYAIGYNVIQVLHESKIIGLGFST